MLTLVPINFNDLNDSSNWQNYIESHRDTHCVDRAEWRLLFRELYGIPDYSWASMEGDQICGVFSLYHLYSPLMGNMLISCPFFGYGGFYSDTTAARTLLLDKIDVIARQLNVDYIELRLPEKLSQRYFHQTDFQEFTLSLANTPDDTWKNRLTSNARQNIRKAQRNEMVFTITDNYYSVFRLLSHTMQIHGTPFHGQDFFRLLKKYFKDEVSFSEVWYQNKLVAGGIIIRSSKTVITPYIGSLNKYRQLGSNYCQYWGIINYCHDQGIRIFDMGRSPKGSTHANFKQKWGAKAIPAFYNYRVINQRKKYRSVSQPTNLQLLATDIWKRLPLFAARLIGPHLFRHIP